MTTVLAGRPAAPGIALGPAFVLTARALTDVRELLARPPAGDAASERTRLDAALARAADELEAIGRALVERIGPEEAEIFASHAEFARDPELRALADAAIADGRSAVAGVTEAFATFAELLAGVGSELLGSRVTDLEDVRDRVVDHLLGRAAAAEVPTEPAVIVAHELMPSQSAALPPAMVLGFVTETGSPTSHASILARSLGVPSVVGVGGVTGEVRTGDVVALDGDAGEVIVRPDAAAAERVEGRRRELDERRTRLAALRDVAGATSDGHRVELAANVGGPADLDVAREHGAEGAGLVRTELLFEGRSTAPSATEQAEHYRRTLAAFPGRRVVFRTMDIGADKPLPFAGRPIEQNPALGLRGLRLHLARPDLLRTQLEALLTVARDAPPEAGRLAVMFPLVSTADEVDRARGELAAVATAVGIDPDRVELGVMVEVPSAALDADALAERVDFLSIGTNDLLQYVYAADRLNADVMGIGDACEPAFLRLIAGVAEAGQRHGSWVGVCGEAASDPATAVALVGLGVTELSMTPRAVPVVKSALAGVALEDCRAVARAALSAPDALAVRRLLAEVLPDGG